MWLRLCVERKYINYLDKMRFLLDENMPLSVISLLESMSHAVEHVRMTSLRGSFDKEIAEYAKKQNAVLITKDIEFGNILLYPDETHYGLLVLRLPYFFTAKQIVKTLKEFLELVDVKKLVGKRTVLELGRYRMREL